MCLSLYTVDSLQIRGCIFTEMHTEIHTETDNNFSYRYIFVNISPPLHLHLLSLSNICSVSLYLSSFLSFTMLLLSHRLTSWPTCRPRLVTGPQRLLHQETMPMRKMKRKKTNTTMTMSLYQMVRRFLIEFVIGKRKTLRKHKT